MFVLVYLNIVSASLAMVVWRLNQKGIELDIVVKKHIKGTEILSY